MYRIFKRKKREVKYENVLRLILAFYSVVSFFRNSNYYC